MEQSKIVDSLAQQGILNPGEIYYNLSTPELYEHAVTFGEGEISEHGALVVSTVPFTGRAADDKFFVVEESSKDKIWWNAKNKSLPKEKFQALKAKAFAFLQNRDMYVRDCLICSDKENQMKIRVITEISWHSMFVQNMFIEAPEEMLENFTPDFTVISIPNFKSVPEIDGTRAPQFIALSFDEKIAIIAGTPYSGEIKKSVFTVLNYILPNKNVFPMHCSANVGKDGDTALFFGLSGTGKTTLSTDPERALIGDDEHGWDEHGVFNFEGGCYAKVINLSAESEPIIYKMTRTFGTILENVVMDDETRAVDLFDDSVTENTRASYSRNNLNNIVPENRGPQPKNVVFLTADAFGVMPPIARLTPEQAMYHFLSGYTAKVAGTEAGLKEPSATFSTCFGGVFMVHHPSVYANLLRDRVEKTGAQVWLVNTGWSGGEYGVGKRMSIHHTRALLRAALNGDLNNVEYITEPFFGLSIPTSCPGVPDEVLNPRNTWADKEAYDKKAQHLVGLFEKNFQQFADNVSEEVRNSMKPAAMANS